jgi:hypothetical protein
MFGQTNMGTMPAQKESFGGGKKPFVPFKKKGMQAGKMPMGGSKAPRAFGTEPDADEGGLTFAEVMGKHR